MNKIIVIGHLGRDPEMRYTPNGQGVTSFKAESLGWSNKADASSPVQKHHITGDTKH